ncbi:Outer membrane lipoprotein-sorting protein [Segatella buccae]|uniref:Outer membrane lipoprotein-sorting protein n=1 Tax=Segatella buccae TaxID=28126 RepID=A0AAQ1UG36_9BACT|nr:LolA-like putative outer membrane lipoprotein chaperone [Segatella buccae]SUB79218.1 Outer membrane lipoprotein-sorting protein [Segatella buccae]
MKKKIVLMALAIVVSLCSQGQTARQVLDKTAAVIGRKGGAQANFKLTGPQYGTISGTLAIKGNKFQANTSEAIVWYDGKTQWSYLRKTNEVNVTHPTQAQQMAMNPYSFINIYKTGYDATLTTTGSNHVVHLSAQNKNRTVQELYITINRTIHVPSLVKMRNGTNWTTINISNFKAKNQSDATFVFRSKDFPHAEVIDLR